MALLGDLLSDGHKITSVDLGGGLGIDYELGGEADPEERVRAYADAVAGAFAHAGEASGRLQGALKEVQLLLEPGRFLVAQAGALIAEVLYTKQNGDKRFVITNAGMNDLLRPSLYGAHHAIVPVEPAEDGSPRRAVDVVGPVCETGDFFARDRELPELRTGDLLAVLDAGAYGMSLASNYNTRPRPAEVLVDGRDVRQIRRRETVRELLAIEKKGLASY